MVFSYQVWKIAAVLSVVLSSSGCAAIDNGTTTIKPSPLSSYSEDLDSEVGSRNNPIALGVPVVISDWKVQVISVNKDALQLVLSSDSYATKPSSNERFLMIKIKATYIGEESGEPSSDLRFKIVGSRGNTFTKSCGYFMDTFTENGEAFPGATVMGNLCFTVDANQIIGAVVSIQGGYSSENRQFISLDSN
jgi:hypothetical protein